MDDYFDISLDPEWTICRKFNCGHIQHSCCESHLDEACHICG